MTRSSIATTGRGAARLTAGATSPPGVTTPAEGRAAGLVVAGGASGPGHRALLSEGEPDALAALSALNGAADRGRGVAGVRIPTERVTAELAHAATVYLALDGDDAGRKAADRVARALQSFTELRVLRLGDGEDLASRLYGEKDREGWLPAALERRRRRRS